MSMSKLQLEKKYGVTITVGTYWSPFGRKFRNDYKIFSADGCCWDKGYSTLKEVEKMCREDAKGLLEIKRKVEEYKNTK